MQVIGLAGRAGSGKSEVASHIAERYPAGKCVILPFAGPLKDLCRREFGWDGRKDGKGRRLLQVVGTDAGRAYNPRIWVDKWRADADYHRRQGCMCIIADDVRFANECGEIRALGGVVWRVDRPDQIVTGEVQHVSELPLADHLVDGAIDNRGSLAALKYRVDTMMLQLIGGAK